MIQIYLPFIHDCPVIFRGDNARRLFARLQPGDRERLPYRPEAIDWRTYWNFPGEMPDDMRAWRDGGDTGGTVARAADGSFDREHQGERRAIAFGLDNPQTRYKAGSRE